MTPKLHPLVLLLVVMVLGIVIWPMLQKSGSVPKNTFADGLAVLALVGGYYLYKKWYEGVHGSVGERAKKLKEEREAAAKTAAGHDNAGSGDKSGSA